MMLSSIYVTAKYIKLQYLMYLANSSDFKSTLDANRFTVCVTC